MPVILLAGLVVAGVVVARKRHKEKKAARLAGTHGRVEVTSGHHSDSLPTPETTTRGLQQGYDEKHQMPAEEVREGEELPVYVEDERVPEYRETRGAAI